MNLSLKSIFRTAILALTCMATASESRLLLPEHCYAAPGINMNVYFRNVFRAIRPDAYFYQVECAKGHNMKDRWTFTPKASDIGTYDWKLTVYDDNGEIAQGSMKLHVVPPRKDPRISIIPSVLNLDGLNNFPVEMQPVNVHNPRKILRQVNALHPAKEGGDQVGDTFYCWILWNLNAGAEKNKTN